MLEEVVQEEVIAGVSVKKSRIRRGNSLHDALSGIELHCRCKTS